MLVQLNLDIHAYYESTPPVYRIWINDTLYLEREYWIDWKATYIEEELHVDLEKGTHTILLEKIVTGATNKIWVEKMSYQYVGYLTTTIFGIDPQDKQIINFEIG